MARYLITDSTSSLPAEIISQYQIKVIPLNVNMPDDSFKEGFGPSNAEFYGRLRNETVFPTTSQPSAGDFLHIFKQLQPGDEALVILISASLSGTIQSALMAEKLLNNPLVQIYIIDSHSTCAGLAFQVIKAGELLQTGLSTHQIIESIYALQSRLELYFVVDNLDYLARGGRISKLRGLIGNIFRLKPILHLHDGEIKLFKKVRTSPKAIKKILSLLEDHEGLEKVAIIQVDAAAEASILLEQVQRIYSGPVYIYEPLPVIGSHVGPGTLGLAFY